MGTSNDYSVSPQWLFSIDALRHTPSVATSAFSVGKELYDRARGVEFLFRLGSSLGLLALLVVLFRVPNLNLSCLAVPQAFLGNVHRSHLVSQIFHEILHGGLPQTSRRPPFHSSFVSSDSTLTGRRRRVRVLGNQDRGMWQEIT